MSEWDETVLAPFIGTPLEPLARALRAKTKEERSRLTKEGLQRAKERGVKLGGPAGGKYLVNYIREYGNGHACIAAIEAADAHAVKYGPMFSEIYDRTGSLRKTVAEINARKVPTRRGKNWHAQSVKNLINRFEDIKKRVENQSKDASK